ncbi:CobW family GTP-binding protein [Caproicibacter fermentans]|uniref:GTP-binding protein n=1 Tax=Caproicibacter fermentans TaxID=2576756 RepID=A0A7G8TA52_9FIRM|nr:GTP-binding protein [Caproicibacter fermentans]QNK40493.1 GTP-binding protein [Caproicibacter fermentans]
MDTKIGVISGFLGAGKTTLIQKLLKGTIPNEKVVLIENEFGEVGIDGKLFKQTGIRVREINSGCICCTLAGDFSDALREVIRKYKPDRILIEPSGVGKLSEILPACRRIALRERGEVSFCITVVNALKYKMYAKNFSEFFFDQIENAKTIFLSRTQNVELDRLQEVEQSIREHNPKAAILTTPWKQISADRMLQLAENGIPLLIKNDELPEHHHHADETFQVWSVETPNLFSRDLLESALESLPKYGNILRAKGLVALKEGGWRQFDYVPSERNVQGAQPDFTGRICVIGENLDKPGLAALFQV